MREHERDATGRRGCPRLRRVEQHRARCAERWSERGRGGRRPREPPGPDSASCQRGCSFVIPFERRQAVGRPSSISTREAGSSRWACSSASRISRSRTSSTWRRRRSRATSLRPMASSASAPARKRLLGILDPSQGLGLGILSLAPRDAEIAIEAKAMSHSAPGSCGSACFLRPATADAGLPAPERFELRGVSKSWNGRPVLDAVDLVLEPGMLVALVGANGAGKTTLLRIAAGLIAPDRGTVKVDGLDVRRPTGGPTQRQVSGPVPPDPAGPLRPPTPSAIGLSSTGRRPGLRAAVATAGGRRRTGALERFASPRHSSDQRAEPICRWDSASGSTAWRWHSSIDPASPAARRAAWDEPRSRRASTC